VVPFLGRVSLVSNRLNSECSSPLKREASGGPSGRKGKEPHHIILPGWEGPLCPLEPGRGCETGQYVQGCLVVELPFLQKVFC